MLTNKFDMKDLSAANNIIKTKIIRIFNELVLPHLIILRKLLTKFLKVIIALSKYQWM
jgi:hypothetical protein